MKLLVIIGVFLLSLASVTALHVQSSTTHFTATLTSVDGPGSGTAAVRISSGIRETTTVRITTKDLPYLGRGGLYEAWLVDQESNYKQSIGVFQSLLSGQTVLTYTIQDDLSAVDLVVITKEPFPDRDPRPGKTVLLGELTKQTRSRFRSTFSSTQYRYSERGIRYIGYPLGKR